MTAVSSKKVEGFVEETTPSEIMVSKKIIYIPHEKREQIKAMNILVGDAIRIIYDKTGNLITAERIPKEKIPPKFVPAKIIDSDAEQAKKLHIQQSIGADNTPQPGADKESGVYIQKLKDAGFTQPSMGGKDSGIYIQQPEAAEQLPQKPVESKPEVSKEKPLYFTEREKNNSIILESVLARAVEIVNAQYRDSPEIDYKYKQFVELLDTRCNHIENVTDRLFAYVKKKVDDEQRKGH